MTIEIEAAPKLELLLALRRVPTYRHRPRMHLSKWWDESSLVVTHEPVGGQARQKALSPRTSASCLRWVNAAPGIGLRECNPTKGGADKGGKSGYH